MKNNVASTVYLCLLFLFSSCVPIQEITPEALPIAADTLAPAPTSTDTPEPITLTSTPELLDTDYLLRILSNAFQSTNKEFNQNMEALSARYEGPAVDRPATLILQVQDNLTDDHNGCMQPAAIISFGILRNNPEGVFPDSLESIRVECYTPNSRLLLSYRVTIADLIAFAAKGEVDTGKLEVVQNNLPTITPTAEPTSISTETPIPVLVQPTAASSNSNCSAAYPSVCIPPAPPDLNCSDISFRNFTVLAPDPHGFDRNNDGLGCEN